MGITGISVNDFIQEIDTLGKKFNNINFALFPSDEGKIEDFYQYFEDILTGLSVGNNLFIHNHAIRYGNHDVNPQIISKLAQNDNFSGLIDSFQNINYCKQYLKLMDDNFSFLCANEENLNKFFQMIPKELRNYAGIVPNIANIINLPSKLYFCVVEEKILEMHQLQEQINDIRNKIYDLKAEISKEERGLKYAFFTIYKSNFPQPINEYYDFLPEFNQLFEDITQNRIEATVKYLINQKQIYQLYFLGRDEVYQLNEIVKVFSNIDILLNQGKINKIIGPLKSDKNVLYRVNFEKNSLIFRFYTYKVPDYEEFVKEKLLYPLIDNTIDPKSPEIKDQIRDIIYSRKGSYIFNRESPPIIPVANLIYYDETKETVPYTFSIKEFLPGQSLLELYNQYSTESFNFSKSKFLNLFSHIGALLGKLHRISFDSFEDQIQSLGKKSNKKWMDVFSSKLDLELSKLKKFNLEMANNISRYFEDSFSLIEEEYEPVLSHNDYQWSNIIVEDTPNEIRINGLIDFDHWGIGVRALDFVKMESEVFDIINNNDLNTSFFEGYKKYYSINNDFVNKIKLYSLFSAMKALNKQFYTVSNNRDKALVNIEEYYNSQSYKKVLDILNTD